MPNDDIYGRKEYDFSYKIVDVRDEQITIKDMLKKGWKLGDKKFGEQINANPAILLQFYKKKTEIFK